MGQFQRRSQNLADSLWRQLAERGDRRALGPDCWGAGLPGEGL